MCLLTHLLGCDTWPNTNFEVVTVSDKITESTYLIRDRCLHDTYFSMLNFRDAFKKKKKIKVSRVFLSRVTGSLTQSWRPRSGLPPHGNEGSSTHASKALQGPLADAAASVLGWAFSKSRSRSAEACGTATHTTGCEPMKSGDVIHSRLQWETPALKGIVSTKMEPCETESVLLPEPREPGVFLGNYRENTISNLGLWDIVTSHFCFQAIWINRILPQTVLLD